jgi:hypothetical protein
VGNGFFQNNSTALKVIAAAFWDLEPRAGLGHYPGVKSDR